MPIEIERKFLVNSTGFKKDCYDKIYIKQGFLNSNKYRVVRIRVIDETGYITIKGLSYDHGTSRFEWEKEISKDDAEQLLLLSETAAIEKIRYLVKIENHIVEVDEFLGDNKGLYIAEIELHSVGELYKKPLWLGKEVTGKKKYYNATLSKKPYNTWKRKPQKK
ncbi:MAG TPA: CYTH domain-containing protein [Flavobacteriia bacterium]|nr:CYTH domain-containing protein [Flavobacteriia bacterium]